MDRSGLQPQEFGFSVALKACTTMHDFMMGELLQGDVKNAQKFFEGILLCRSSEPLWNKLLDGYAQTCDVEEAFSILKVGFEGDTFVCGALVDTYGKFGLLADACNLFWNLAERDNVAWCALLAGFLQNGEAKLGLNLFLEFLSNGTKPDPFSFAIVFSLCSKSDIEGIGPQVHCSFIKYGFALDSFLGSALIDIYGNRGIIWDAYMCFTELYAECGVVDEAKMVFKVMTMPNEFSWTTVILGCCQLGRFSEALRLCSNMFFAPVIAKLSHFTVVPILQACMGLKDLDEGKQIHGYVMKVGYECYPFVGTALFSVYAALKNEIQNASLSMSQHDLVAWSTMITWVQNGCDKGARKTFAEFQSAPIFPIDDSILSSCLSASVGLASQELGKWFHACSFKTGKCGGIKDALKFFDELNAKNVVSWTDMISGYAHHVLGREAVELFEGMKEAGLKPDAVTFIGVLTSCSHSGLLNEALMWDNKVELRNKMKEEYVSKKPGYSWVQGKMARSAGHHLVEECLLLRAVVA
ncbi:unnamed protein product [Ilex paraguariensis]|uniref:Pentatricopeptide repeat-containing protein n=1 Tax=Ilex paraguariensis TaxID=185542 RepID=A0ABC8RSU6_9AQUA